MYSLQISSESRLNKYPARQHAKRVAEKLGVHDGLIYLQGVPTVFQEDSDQTLASRQRRSFYYLSGVDEVDCHLTYDIARDSLLLWLAPFTPQTVVWLGRGSTVEEARNKYDVDDARYSDKLQSYLEEWKSSNRSTTIYILHESQHPSITLSRPRWDVPTNTTNLLPAINACRLIKDSHEIALIEKANDISSKAHMAIMKRLKTLRNEAQVEGLFLDVCTSHNAHKQAYPIIAASGTNASVLHYDKNDELFGNRNLICLDAGAEWHCYASDITRTVPLSGNWSTEEKAIYELVQEMQESAFEFIKPGVKFIDAHILCHRIAIRGLLRLGILYNGSEETIFEKGTSTAFFPHGLGHHIGLDVHDLARSKGSEQMESDSTSSEDLIQSSFNSWPANMCSKQSSNSNILSGDAGILRPGMVITVEPGIYFNKYALDNLFLNNPTHANYINKKVVDRYIAVGGVRIEDDIVVTNTGYRNLTSAPKGEEALRIIRCEV